MYDGLVIAQLAAEGDDVDRPRLVEHEVRFAAPDAANDFAREMTELGYRSGRTMQAEDVVVTVSRSVASLVTMPNVTESTWEVRRRAEAHGGTYEGWGCPIVGSRLGRWRRRRRFAATSASFGP